MLAALALVVLVGGVGAYLAAAVGVDRRDAPSRGPRPAGHHRRRGPDRDRTRCRGAGGPGRGRLDRGLGRTTSSRRRASGSRRRTAKGAVRFANLDFLRSNTIPGGSIVSTNAGVRFRTAKRRHRPRADLVGLTVFPGRRQRQRDRGRTGHRRQRRAEHDRRSSPRARIRRRSRSSTRTRPPGGTHEEFPQVAQEDVDKAIEQLPAALDAAFQARLADPSIAPPGATVFETTATLGEPTPSVDPATLVGQEIETFEIGLSATGTVVDGRPGPGRPRSRTSCCARRSDPATSSSRTRSRSTSAHPVVSGQSVSFSATATGQEVAIARRRTSFERWSSASRSTTARELLAPYGDVELTAWPDWVGSDPDHRRPRGRCAIERGRRRSRRPRRRERPHDAPARDRSRGAPDRHRHRRGRTARPHDRCRP